MPSLGIEHGDPRRVTSERECQSSTHLKCCAFAQRQDMMTPTPPVCAGTMCSAQINEWKAPRLIGTDNDEARSLALNGNGSNVRGRPFVVSKSEVVPTTDTERSAEPPSEHRLQRDSRSQLPSINTPTGERPRARWTCGSATTHLDFGVRTVERCLASSSKKRMGMGLIFVHAITR